MLLAARGSDLAATIRTRDGAMADLRRDLEAEAVTAVEEINRLTSEIAFLNREIVTSENGGLNPRAANDLRDRRESLVNTQLSPPMRSLR